MADIDEKRAYVTNYYGDKKKNWATKVRHMSDIQVTAIYLRMKTEEAEADVQPKPKETDDEIPF